jgi:uncharacterized membrane protein YphA (DoxX/SURF4 family)
MGRESRNIGVMARYALRMPTGANANGLRVLSLFMGVFFLFMGLDKLAWLRDDDLLIAQLTDWLATSPAASRWYLQTIAIPAAPAFARLVPVGELAVGVALLTGLQPRVAALLGFFMVLNFHFAMGVMLRYSYLWNAYGPPVLGGLLALVIGGTRLPFSVSSGSTVYPRGRSGARPTDV